MNIPIDDMNAECERKTTIARETNSRANAMQAIKEDAPVMKAWNNYKSSDEFKNTRKWALHEEHVDGSLWAAFYAGFFACAVDQVNAEGPKPPKWYTRNEVIHILRRMKYSDEIAQELADWIVRHLQLAFNKGFEMGGNKSPAPPSASQPDPVAKVKRNSGVSGREFVGETLEFRDLPVGTKLYTAPASGVKEGMLLDALQRAQRVMHGEGVEDQGEAWDKCAQILDEAITRAADQVNAEGQDND